MQDFVKTLYAMGQSVLQNRHGHDGDKADKYSYNVYTLVVQTNAVCIELLLWTMQDDTGQSRSKKVKVIRVPPIQHYICMHRLS